MLDLLRQCQHAHEVGEVVAEGHGRLADDYGGLVVPHIAEREGGYYAERQQLLVGDLAQNELVGRGRQQRREEGALWARAPFFRVYAAAASGKEGWVAAKLGRADSLSNQRPIAGQRASSRSPSGVIRR